MGPYDIGAAFEAIEDELIASMIRNMKRHRVEEISQGIQWSQWQAEQLKALEKFKKQNQRLFSGKFKEINSMIEDAIKAARQQGNMDQEIAILEAIKGGFKGARKQSRGTYGEFFQLNNRKLNALIKATTDDFKNGETAMLRQANDQYRQIIYNAQVYANTGAGTYEKAVDMATKDFLSRGITCIEYANGARHAMKDYADMAIRTAAKRAYLTGEGEKRQEWGMHTVILNKRGDNPCPKCLPFVGKVLIDDVWSGGSSADGSYPLMSHAIARGLYHPRCRDSHTTYFPGLSTVDDTWTQEELDSIEWKNRQEAKQQYVKRQEEKYDRLAKYSLDAENQKQYTTKKEQWKIEAENLKNDSGYQERINQRRAEWKKQHSVFDKESAKAEINSINSQIQEINEKIENQREQEKLLEKKVYFDGTGTADDMDMLKKSVATRKNLQEQVDTLRESVLDKQEVYKNEAENRILKTGTVEEIKLSKRMTPETVDALERTLTELKNKYGIMPKGIVYNPKKVPDATASYNWLDDKIYLSNKFNDIEKYADTVKKSEDSLVEYRAKSGIINKQKERLKNAEKILSDKTIKGYEREKAIIAKAEAEIELNIQRMGVRENLMDVMTHEYGHFIHRHANVDYVQKKSVFGAKDLGGKLMNGDWGYDINTRYSARAKIEAASISKYATESPYETFAEGFLAREKGEKIPDRIVKIIEEAERNAGVKNVVKSMDSDIMISGARITDLGSAEAETFADMYYKEIRSFTNDSTKIAANLGKEESDIRRIKAYLFEEDSLVDQDTGERRRFDPDCAIAQSWQRLMIGKDIKPHDRTLIEHELLEMRIKQENPGIAHVKAHELASEKYNYPKEVLEYYGNLKKHNKGKG